MVFDVYVSERASECVDVVWLFLHLNENLIEATAVSFLLESFFFHTDYNIWLPSANFSGIYVFIFIFFISAAFT